MGSKETKAGKTSDSIFKLYSLGIVTSRDAWAYNSSHNRLAKNMKSMISYCNKQDLNNLIFDPKHANWSNILIKRLKKHKPEFNKR